MKTKRKNPIAAAAEEQRELTTLRIAGVPEHFNLPWMLALERRAFVRAGIELKWRTVPEGTGAMCELLRKGELDLAIMVTEGAVRDILNGNPARIVAAYVDTPLTWGVHVGAGSGMQSPEQLASVPYAISRPNSGSHLVAMAYAGAHGRTLQTQDLEVVNDLKGALVRLQQAAPAAFLWEKYTTKPYVDAGELLRVDEYQNPWPAFVLVASDAVLAEHPDKVLRALKVIRDQAAGLMQKKTASEMIAQRYKLELEDAQAWFSGVRWNTGQKLHPEALGEVMQALQNIGALPEAVKLEDALDLLLPDAP
ncbi:MAG: ABC transporter substrate-binding protein [Flavobacteriales bacterium]|nr:ABC transporter substrate-binding protein [Flavobacteriales bacterium]